MSLFNKHGRIIQQARAHKMTRKSSWATGAVVASMLLATGCASGGGSTTGGGEGKILIGAYAGTSGPVALTARDLIRGWELAFDEVNAGGGINGRDIELKVRDDTYDPARAVTVVRDLVQNDEVLAVTGLGSPTTLAVHDFLTTQEVPNLFPVSAASSLYKPPTEWTFIAGPTYTAQAYVSVKYGIEERGVTKLGIMGLNDEAGEDVAAGCQAAAKELGVEVVGRHTFEPSTTDFTAQMSDLRSKGADGVCIANPLELTGLELKQAERLDWHPVFMGFSSQANTALAELAGPKASEGLVAVSTFLPTGSDEPAVKKFVNAYTSKYDNDAPTFFSQYGYWSGHLMAEALADAGEELTRDSLREAILAWKDHADSTGLSGPLSFSKDQPNGLNNMFVVEMRDGKVVAVTDAQAAPQGL